MSSLLTSWDVTSWRGAPVRVHWSVPALVLVATAVTGHAGAWLACLGMLLLHEVAHAEVARWLGARVHAIHVVPFGGLCLYEDVLDPVERSLVAAAGPAVHVLGIVAAAAFARAFGAVLSAAAHEGLLVFFGVNLMFLAVNALPMPPLDGAEGWKLPVRLLRRARARRAIAATVRSMHDA